MSISRWSDVAGISEADIIERHGLNEYALILIDFVWRLKPYAEDLQVIMKRAIDNGYNCSFENVVMAWIADEIHDKHDKRHAKIIMGRMGFGYEEPHTLEQIANQGDKKITRERVRQIVDNKFTVRLEKQRFNHTDMLYPFWSAIDSLLYSSCGVISTEELQMGLKAFFLWEKKPSRSAINNLINLAPSYLPLKAKWDSEIGTLVRTDNLCYQCATAVFYLHDLIAELREVLVSDVINDLNLFCDRKICRFNESFLDSLIDGHDMLKQNVRKQHGYIYHIDRWNLLYGKLLQCCEAILKKEERAMHFTEVWKEVIKYRPDDSSITERSTQGALDRSENTFLWDRGTFIHRCCVSLPIELLNNIEGWIVNALQSKNLPYLSVNRVFIKFEVKCKDVGIPTATALYMCLRECSGEAIKLPAYPQIYLEKESKISLSVVLDEYVKEADAIITEEEMKQYFLNQIGIKDFMLSQQLGSNLNIVRVAKKRYIHRTAIHFDSMIESPEWRDIRKFAVSLVEKKGYASVTKIFKERIVDCKSIGISTPEMLHSLLRIYAEDVLDAAAGYPKIIGKGKDYISVSANILEHVKHKKGPCQLSEIEKHFVEDLGYSEQCIWSVRNKDVICSYVTGMIVHTESLQWSKIKNNSLCDIAMSVYHDALQVERPYGLIDDMIERMDLPSLDNDIPYTAVLIADLLMKGNKFTLIGNKKNAFVPKDNAAGIETLQDLLYILLKEKCGGASNFKEFEDMLVEFGIIIKNLTPAMIENSSKIRHIGQEIMLKELEFSHAS